MKKIAILLFLTFPSISFASQNLAITTWEEEATLTKDGKISEISIRAKAQNLAANQLLSGFEISFGQNRNIAINKVICDGQNARFSFTNNALKISFPNGGKANNYQLSLFISFEEKYDKINNYLRQEAINIPPFASGAEARVIISFPGSFESATLNPNLTKIGNSFIYRSQSVPSAGINEIIKLTSSQEVWDVALQARIFSDKPLGKIKATTPILFQNGLQRVMSYITSTSEKTVSMETKNGFKIFEFNSPSTQVVIQNKAKIAVGEANRIPTSRNPAQYLAIKAEDLALVTPFLAQAQSNPKYRNLPLYAQIGKFVHEFLKYDLSYKGKLPSLREILQNRIGVCSEFATLYTALARSAKIPAVTIDGAACGEYDDCQLHAWNLIYVDGKWIEVDPTWDLMSGVVSSSHIFFSESGKRDLSFEYLDNSRKVDSQLDFKMQKSD